MGKWGMGLPKRGRWDGEFVKTSSWWKVTGGAWGWAEVTLTVAGQLGEHWPSRDRDPSRVGVKGMVSKPTQKGPWTCNLQLERIRCGCGCGSLHTSCWEGRSRIQCSFVSGHPETWAPQRTRFNLQAVEPRRSRGSLLSLCDIQLQRMPGYHLARKLMVRERCQESHRGSDAALAPLCRKRGSLVGPGGSRMNLLSRTPGTGNTRAFSQQGVWHGADASVFRENSIASIFVFPDRRVWCYPPGRKRCSEGNPGAVAKGTDSGQPRAPNIHPMTLGSVFSFRSLWKGLLFLESFVVVCFPFAFCFGRTVGMALDAEGLKCWKQSHHPNGTLHVPSKCLELAQRLSSAHDLLKEHRCHAVAGWLLYSCFAPARLTQLEKGSHVLGSHSRSTLISG